MISLLYKGEVLDLEAIAAAPKDEDGYVLNIGLNARDAVRAYSPCHGIHEVTTMMVNPAGHISTVVHFGDYAQTKHGCGFCRAESTCTPIEFSDYIPLKFIKTQARQALEHLRARLDKGVII
jgi:hypothetical protein